MKRLLPILLVLLLTPLGLADEVITTSGRVIRGRISSVEITPDASFGEHIARHELASVQLEGDRRLLDLLWLTRTQRFALDREVEADASVGIYVGRGAFPPSAIAVVRRLDAAGKPPRLLFARDITRNGLAKVKRLVFPGGWAPSMNEALGTEGLDALRKWVKKGGRYFGICAGAFLPCRKIRWAGVDLDYPLGLVAGIAVGPLDQIARWPESAGFDLVLDDDKVLPALYAGGCRLEVENCDVLARYPGGGIAAMRVRAGKGRLVLTGAHVEFDVKKDRDLLDQDGWAEKVDGLDARAFDALWRQLE